MIVVKTANGARFINETETQSVAHNKESNVVSVRFKDGHKEVFISVESMYYTNKEGVEIHDNGLALAYIESDLEYYKALNASACDYLSSMAEYRSRLENMVIQMYESPDSDPEYRKRFVEEMREQWSRRPGTIEAELNKYRGDMFYCDLRKNAREKGERFEKEYIRMLSKINTLKEEIEGYQGFIDHMMKRSLWQRILNKEK